MLMLKLLRQQIQRWQDKRDQLDYFRENPMAAIVQQNVSYRQACAAIEVDPDIYVGLTFSLYAQDKQNDWKLLRAMVAHGPAHLARAKNQHEIPIDLLLAGLESPYIWSMVKVGWIAYQNPEFAVKHPKVLDLIGFVKTMEFSEEECTSFYLAWRNRNNAVPSSSSTQLPNFD